MRLDRHAVLFGRASEKLRILRPVRQEQNSKFNRFFRSRRPGARPTDLPTPLRSRGLGRSPQSCRRPHVASATRPWVARPRGGNSFSPRPARAESPALLRPRSNRLPPFPAGRLLACRDLLPTRGSARGSYPEALRGKTRDTETRREVLSTRSLKLRGLTGTNLNISWPPIRVLPA